MSSGADETVVMGTSSAASSDEGRFVSGTLLGGRYRILNLLGKGGMGEVYRATDLTLGQSVALKFLPAEAAANPGLLERFHGEVRVARQVSHPNVCRVYDIGQAEGMPYISMEYVDGDDLAALLERIGRLPEEKALEIARKLCAGLAAAHSRGVIHRDLKPQNIMLNKRGEVLIMDFGLAAIADQLSGAEARNGTPAYMSPEQLKGIEVTAKSDIYSLGLILYELFTGKKPFQAKTIAQLIEAQEATQLGGEFAPEVEKVVRACLQPDAARRPGSALSVAAALPGGDPLAAALAAGETPTPELVAAAGRHEGLERRWALLGLGVVLTCVAAGLVMKQQLNSVNVAPVVLAPAVLEQRGREVMKALGYEKEPQDRQLYLVRRGGYIKYFNELPGSKQWERWLTAEPMLDGWYRQSPKWLYPEPTGTEIRDDNPPPTVPGMADVMLDGLGRLRSFTVVPYVDAQREPVDVDVVFREAGLEREKFESVAAEFTPRFGFDERLAFRGKHPQLPEVELGVEVARYRGQLIHARVTGPWTAKPTGETQPARTQSTAELLRNLIGIAAIGAGVVFAPLLARRNWKKGRADRKGALRVALARFAVGVGFWISMVHATPTFGLLEQFLNMVGLEMLQAGMLWVLYLALEPALRAKWPHSIVTWNRVLAGNWRDSQVAAHVLIGCAAGCALWTLFTVRALVLFDSFGPNVGGALMSMDSVRGLSASLFGRLKECLSLGLLGFFFLFGAKTLLRRDWLAAMAGALLFPLIESGVVNSTNRLPIFLVYVVVYAVMLMIMLRLGVVATMMTMLMLNVTGTSSLGLNLTTWWAPNGLLAMSLVLLVAVWSFQQSLGRRELLGDAHQDVTSTSLS
jgi:predicted Ser/Thr protein kinase